MPQVRLHKILNSLIESCYLVIVFFVPVYFALFLKNANVFELNKIILFKILILLLLCFSLIKIIIQWNAPLRISAINKKYLIIPLLFFLALVLSAFFSINQENSFYGLYGRQQGLVSYVYYFAFFILLLLNINPVKYAPPRNIAARQCGKLVGGFTKSDNFISNGVNTKAQIKRIIIAVVLSSFFVSLYGIAQRAGFDFLSWMEPAILTKRATSTFGQPNFLASYLLLVIPLAVYLFFQSKKFLNKFALFIVFLFNLLCLFFTGSRAGWLGLFFGIIFTGAAFLLLNKKNINPKYFKPRFLLLGLLALTITAVFFFNSDCYFARRVKLSADITKGSGAARMNFYKASISAMKDKPIFGYGLENQGEVFVQYYGKDWAESGKINVYPNRAHNLFLDIILTSGFIGLIFYLALLYLFFKLIIDNIKNNKSEFLSWMILLAVVSYLISLMFGFSVVATDIYFWLFFAVVIIINSERGIKVLEKSEEDVLCDYKYCLLIKLLKVFLIAIISAGILFQISKEFKKLIADHYFRELQLSYVNQEYFKAFTLYDYIKSTKVKSDYYDRNFGIMLADKIDDFNTVVLSRTGEEALENIAENLSGNSYANIFARAKIYAALASEEKQDYYNLAKDNFEKIISLSSEMPKNYRELAKMYFKKGDYETAISNYQKALTMAPDASESMSKMHKEFIEYEKYLIYNGLGDAYFKKELYKEAEYYYWLAYKNNMPDIIIFRKIADIYYLQGDIGKAIWYNKRGYMLNPKDYSWPFAVALLYQEQEDKDNALIYAEKALGLAPKNEQVKEFIKNLK